MIVIDEVVCMKMIHEVASINMINRRTWMKMIHEVTSMYMHEDDS